MDTRKQIVKKSLCQIRNFDVRLRTPYYVPIIQPTIQVKDQIILKILSDVAFWNGMAG